MYVEDDGRYGERSGRGATRAGAVLVEWFIKWGRMGKGRVACEERRWMEKGYNEAHRCITRLRRDCQNTP